MNFPALDHVVMEAGSRDLYFADVNILGGRRTAKWRQVHGSTYAIAACLGVTVKEMLRATVDEINAVNLAHCDLRASLFSVRGEPLFKSLAPSSKPRMTKRIELMELTASRTICLLNNTVLPLDGRTLRAHFELIWAVFGFPLKPLPHATHALALTSIADARNDIAHGEVTAEQVARRQPIADTLNLVERADEVLLNLHGAIDLYLQGGGYVR